MEKIHTVNTMKLQIQAKETDRGTQEQLIVVWKPGLAV